MKTIALNFEGRGFLLRLFGFSKVTVCFVRNLLVRGHLLVPPVFFLLPVFFFTLALGLDGLLLSLIFGKIFLFFKLSLLLSESGGASLLTYHGFLLVGKINHQKKAE